MFIEEDLYRKIVILMPIPCVDLVIENESGNILMVKRKNEPAKDKWWFPGGRIFHGETREAAVNRKLFEECGLNGKIIREIGTYDLLLPYKENQGTDVVSHGISSFFLVQVQNSKEVTLDFQSSEFDWRPKVKWLEEPGNDPVIVEVLKTLGNS